jgi:hypothetical protein
MKKSVANSIKHPEAWKFWIEQCRNITEEPNLCELGDYRIPVPDQSGNFLYGETLHIMWNKFIRAWYSPKLGLNSPSAYGKIQYIVEKFKN